MVQRPDAILIAGPTASGKSKLAIDEALRWDGEIVNTDSMQIYPVLDILTARPDAEDLAKVPHHLYGTAALDEPYSVARWMEDASVVAQQIWSRGRVPVFVGGTGLYFRGLENGLAATPEIPSEIRDKIRTDLIELGSEKLHLQLAEIDPDGAAKLRPSDGHRIARALEVIRGTNRPLSHYQNLPHSRPLLAEKSCQKTVLMPPRNVLHDRINMRTDWMIEQGAVAEVEALLGLELPADATVLKAIGVRQLGSYLHGKLSLKQATEQVKAATRQYAKRQSTWFNGQFDADWRFRDIV
ncbi:MAG: tRNA (adenosine(37)-N6)-dimethylallyltransferase MiaA [Hyphomicrobiales bacterium]|nr:tRNA (adenosine(37)-N6)-dimethylallyltransferase MiaA [Hyphomicrobiales bacterium]